MIEYRLQVIDYRLQITPSAFDIAFGDFLVARYDSSELGSALTPTSVPPKAGGEYGVARGNSYGVF